MLKKPKIIAVLCGESAIFCLAEGMETKFRVFCPTLDFVDKTDLMSLMQRYSEAPLYIMLDNPEQTYNSQRLPGVGSFSIAKLASRRLERDFNPDDIKGAVNYGRDKSGRKDWRFLFVNMPMTEELKSWMDFLGKFPNPMMGVYFLPLETLHLVRQVRKGKDKKKKGAKAAGDEKKWLFLSLTQKTGGIRQIILEDDSVFFTRYVRYQVNAAPESIAGVIEQEMANTIDYLRRLSYTDKDTTRAIVVASNEIKHSLADSEFGGIKTEIYSPYELSMQAGLAGACRLDDKYTDILAAVAFLNAKPVLRLFTETVKKNYRLYFAAKLARYASVLMVPTFFAVTGYVGWSILQSKDDVVRLENKKAAATQAYNAAIAQKRDITEEKAKEILSAAAVYSELASRGGSTPRTMTDRMAAAKQSVAKIKDFKWGYSPAETGGRGGAPSPASESFRISLDFVNAGGSPESLFGNFEEFSRAVNKQFEGYDIQYSKLPDRLTFNNKTDVVPVNITVTQKSEEDKRR
jgi:hypothetical protein